MREVGQRPKKSIQIQTYSQLALPHLKKILRKNKKVLERLSRQIVQDVLASKSLFIFGSGHSALFGLELFHRAGGASFVIPMVVEQLLPSAGPTLVRKIERIPGVATRLLERSGIQKGEMLWLASQSGINGAVVDLAFEAKRLGVFTVAFTSIVHSRTVLSRHPTGKKLFEVCDDVVDLSGRVGDASVVVAKNLFAGPLSTLTSIFLGHSILVDACAKLETLGVRCIYTSVNTPDGEVRNRELELRAALRDPLMRVE